MNTYKEYKFTDLLADWLNLKKDIDEEENKQWRNKDRLDFMRKEFEEMSKELDRRIPKREKYE